MSLDWDCKVMGHSWNLTAEKCTVCGIPVSDVTLTPEQREEFNRLNNSVKSDNHEIVITLSIKTFGTKDQAEQTLARFKSEVALQHFDVTYGTEFIRDSTTFAERFTTEYISANEVRSIIDRTFGDKVEPDVDVCVPPYKMLDENTEEVDDFSIYRKIVRYADSSIHCEMVVTDIRTGLKLRYVTGDEHLFHRLEPRRWDGNCLSWLQIIDKVSEFVVEATFKVV